MKTFTIAELAVQSQGDLISHIHELMWELALCAQCGGEIHHHMDEPFYTCQKCGITGESGRPPLVQIKVAHALKVLAEREEASANIKRKLKAMPRTAPAAPKRCSVYEMEEMVAKGCSTPGCNHDDHKIVFLRQHCHPGVGFSVRYEKGTGVVNIACLQCKKPVIDVGVALA